MIGKLAILYPISPQNQDILNSVVIIIKDDDDNYTFRVIRYGKHTEEGMFKSRFVFV